MNHTPTPNTTRKIVARSCKFASTHIINRDYARGEKSDLTVVKENLFTENGERIKQLRLIENYERPFWITKDAYRNHKSKKEWEDKEKVNEFRATTSTLNERVQQALGRQVHGGIRRTNRNPYVYGTDLTVPTLLKIQYMNKWPDKHGFPFDVCYYDIETDVLGDFALNDKDRETFGDAIPLASLTMMDRAFTVCLRKFAQKQTPKYGERFFEIMDKDLPHIRARKEGDWAIMPNGKQIELTDGKIRLANGDMAAPLGIPVELLIVDTEKELLEAIFQRLHEWKPDVVSTWNISFDVPRTAARLQANGLDPADYFSDPSIPKKYREYRFIEDGGVQVSASNKKKTKLWYQCWHMVKAPASFRWVDRCSVYWYVRKMSGNLRSAALDYVLKEEIGRGKYEVPEAEQYVKLDKHIFLQRNFAVEYMVYNLFDCIGLIELEHKTKDMMFSLPGMLNLTEFERLHSNPTKLLNNFADFLLFQRNKVPGCTSDQMVDELDKYVVSQKGWIVTLPTNSIEYKGLKCVKELPNMHTKIYMHCADLDVKSSYPSTGIFANISRETTVLELHAIQGVEEHERYTLGLNLMAGNVNAVSFCRTAHKMPSLNELVELYDKSL